MTEYIVSYKWLCEYEKNIENLLGHELTYDSATNCVPPISLKNVVVRCRDCKHFTPRGTDKFENGKTNMDYCTYIRGWMLQITPDGFCAWGERRD